MNGDAKKILILHPIGVPPKTSNGLVLKFIEEKRGEGLSDEEIMSQLSRMMRPGGGRTHVFGIGAVYDKSETVAAEDGLHLPESESVGATELYSRLKHIASQHYTLEEGTVEKARGYTAHSLEGGVRIRVMRVPGEDAEALHTLIHEMSHARLKHLKNGQEYGLNEAEAELSTYLVGPHYGFDFGKDSSAYIASWLKGRKMGEESIDRSMNNARWVIQQIDGSLAG